MVPFLSRRPLTEDDLPATHGVEAGSRKGRSVHDGYQRGWGLQFGDLRERIARDPLYRKASRLAKGRTLLPRDRRMNLYLLLRFYLGRIPGGNIIEFGAYRGGSAIFMAFLAQRLHPGLRVYALDTFTGMPETDKGVDAHSRGDFRNVDLEELEELRKRLDLTNLEFVPGRFEETAPGIASAGAPFSLAHIDCDIYESVALAYESVREAMVPGGYLVFDDFTEASCLGATEAVEDLLIRRDGRNCEQVFPHSVFRVGV